MTIVEYISGNHKLTVEEVNGNTVRLTWFEMMGGRWTMLGTPESWGKDAAAEEVKSFTDNT